MERDGSSPQDASGSGPDHITTPVMTVLPVVEDAPEPDPNRPRPGVKRLARADGADVIAVSFVPGQAWPDHQAAHPIIVQCLSGVLDFATEGQQVRLEPGTVVHLEEGVRHAVSCPDEAPAVNVLLLIMLTGERP